MEHDHIRFSYEGDPAKAGVKREEENKKGWSAWDKNYGIIF